MHRGYSPDSCRLHLVDALVELLSAHDTEVLVQERSVQPLDEAVRLGSAYLRRPAFDLLELEEQLKGMPIGPPAIFPAVIAEHGGDPRPLRLESEEHVVVHDVHGGNQQLVGVKTPLHQRCGIARAPVVGFPLSRT